MTEHGETLRLTESVQAAAEKLARSPAPALPMLDEADRLQGIVTDRDLTNIVADGRDVHTTVVGELSRGTAVVAVAAEDTLDDAARTMADTRVDLVPVVDGAQVVGMLTHADVAAHLPDADAGRFIKAMSSG